MYKKYKKTNNPSLLEMLFEILIAIIFLLGKLIFNLVIWIFSKKDKTNKNNYKVIIDPIPLNITKIDEETPKNDIVDDKRYTLKQSLLSPAEKEFLIILKQIVGDRYIIENQVQLSRIITPLESNNNFTNYSDFNRIKAKSIDFVLFDNNYKPYLCIELDDISHLRWDRIKRDNFVDTVMKDVGLRIIHIRTSYSYNLEDLNKQIFQ